jgi:hypothetical protein
MNWICFSTIAAEDDVGTAARHVGGDGDHLRTAGLGDDFRFAGVLLGVQDVVRQARLAQDPGQQFRVLDRGGADQDRLAALVAVADVGEHRAVFFLGRLVHLVLAVLALRRTVRRDHHGFEAVDFLELVGFRVGGTGHAGQLGVHAEVVLEGDRGQGLVLVLDAHAFLGFHGLVQAVGPAAARHQAAGEFVDDHHFVVLHHVVLVLVVQHVRAQRGVQVVDQGDVGGVVQRGAFRQQAHLGQDGSAFSWPASVSSTVCAFSSLV